MASTKQRSPMGLPEDGEREFNLTLKYEDVRLQLKTSLERIESKGSFAAFDALDDFIDPRIAIQTDSGCETFIPTPLCEDNAKRLISACHKAPFGKGSDTLVDPDVRRTWELDSDQFRITAPGWDKYLEEIIARVAEDLGIGGGPAAIRASLYKMLLYDTGSKFKTHTDTEKEPGMFGTLVICLPSEHEGGAVKVKHASQSMMLQSENKEQSYMCWYSDVKHEVLEVTKGYRWVLTYNLCARSAQKLPRNLLTPSLHATCKAWADLTKAELMTSLRPPYLIMHLEHQYTEANLDLDSLKGADLARTRALQTTLIESDCVMFLAQMEKETDEVCDQSCDYYDRRSYGRNYYDSDDDEEDEDFDDASYHPHELSCNQSYTLKTIVDEYGNLILSDVTVDELSLLYDDHYDGVEPDKEDYEGYTGNAGAQATYRYTDTAVLIISRDRFMEFFTNACSKKRREYSTQVNGAELGISHLLSYILNRIEEAEEVKEEKEMTGKHADEDERPIWNRDALALGVENAREVVAQELAKKAGTCSLKPEEVRNIVDAALHLKDFELAMKASSCLKGEPKLVGLDKYIPKYGLERMSDLLETLLSHCTTLENVVQSLHALLPSPLRPLHTMEYTTAFRNWAKGVVNAALSRFDHLSHDDGKFYILFHQDQSVQNGFRFTNCAFLIESYSTIFDVVLKRINQSSFVLGVFATISQLTLQNPDEMVIQATMVEGRSAAESIMRTDFPTVISQVIKTLDLRNPTEHRSPGSDHYFLAGSRPMPKAACKPFMSGAQLENVLNLCFSYCGHTIHHDTRAFVTSVASQASKVRGTDLVPMLMMFLKGVMTIMRQYDIPCDDDAYRSAFVTIFQVYIDSFVGNEPAEPSNWFRAGDVSTCSCSDCHSLNQFLRSPERQVGHFAMAERRRRHLERTLTRDYKCETTCQRIPYTLVVTKTKMGYQNLHAAWRTRRDAAVQVFGHFNVRQLKQLLGDHYDQICGFERLKAPADQPSLKRPRESAANDDEENGAKKVLLDKKYSWMFGPAKATASSNSIPVAATSSSASLVTLPPIAPLKDARLQNVQPLAIPLVALPAPKKSMTEVSAAISRLHARRKPKAGNKSIIIDLTGDLDD